MEEAVLTYTATKEAELALAKGRSDHLIAALANNIRRHPDARVLDLQPNAFGPGGCGR